MALPESWSIKSRAHKCAISEDKFKDQQDFYTAIFPDLEEGGYLRMDFSEEAWENREEKYQTPFSFWKSTYEEAVHEAKEEVVTKESAEDLLSRLIEEDKEHTENARYILAVMLERKKLLKETDKQQTPNGILRIYEHRKSGEVYIVLDPNIPLDQIEEVQKEVSELLDGNGQNKEQKSSEQESGKQAEPKNSELPNEGENTESETNENNSSENTDEISEDKKAELQKEELDHEDQEDNSEQQ